MTLLMVRQTLSQNINTYKKIELNVNFNIDLLLHNGDLLHCGDDGDDIVDFKKSPYELLMELQQHVIDSSDSSDEGMLFSL